MAGDRKAFLIGGGIGSLAAAAFLVRDGNVPGSSITIFESLPVVGGSLDASGNAQSGYAMRGSRMMTTENFECTWGLFKTIPSLARPQMSVFEEIIDFSNKVKWDAKARLVDRNRAIVDVSTMGFSMADRMELLKLSNASEKKLENTRITDWLSPAFFETNFWHMWATTFAFQPWHSALEFKRYMHRFIRSFSRIEKLSGVKHPAFNHYESLVRPLASWLEKQGVTFLTGCTVSDLALETKGTKVAVKAIHYRQSGRDEVADVSGKDLVFLQNGSMTDASSFGSNAQPAEALTKENSSGWTLWEKLAQASPDFGNPAAFNSCIPESYWLSFTATFADSRFFDQMEAFTGNVAGTGGIVTLKDSRWLMSVVLHHQPHFENQPEDRQVMWGYALHPDRIGDFVAKPMSDCSGAEILRELCGHFNFDESVIDQAICIPCRMPYITSQFMPRRKSDRPLPVPKSSRNLAFVSQYVEIPKDCVFTIEYSIRAAQMAVYELLKIDREIPPVSPHDKSLEAQLKAIIKSFD